MATELEKDFVLWIKEELDKNDRDSSETQLVTEHVHIGTLYADDIINIVSFLEKKGISCRFRILDEVAVNYSDAGFAAAYSLADEVFRSSSDFKEYLESDLYISPYNEFRIFACICTEENAFPVKVTWMGDIGKINIVQDFWEGHQPDYRKENIVHSLAEHIKAFRPSNWYRYEGRMYLFSMACFLAAISIYFRSLTLGVICLVLLWLFNKHITNVIDSPYGMLINREEFPLHFKKLSRIRKYSKPLSWLGSGIAITAIGSLFIELIAGMIGSANN